MIKSFFNKDHRKPSAVFTATVILSVIVLLSVFGLNIIAASVEKRYALSADLSFNALTLQSAVTEENLQALDRTVEIIFLTSSNRDTFGDSVILRNDLRTILVRYQHLSRFISYREESLFQNPLLASKYASKLNSENITEDCLILLCESTDRARMLTANDFIQYQYDLDNQAFIVSAYTIEKSLTEGIIYVSSSQIPHVQFLSGHGELNTSETSVLEKHLNSAGYQAERISLHSEKSLDTSSPLFILCPRFDLSEDELSWLRYFHQEGGSIFYACSYDSPVNLTRFNLLLYDWGISFRSGIVVATGDDQTSYFNDSRTTLLPYMQASPETQALLGSGQDILLIPGSRAVDVSSQRDTDIFAESILKSGEAYIRRFEDGTESLERQDGDETGRFDLAVLARRYDGETPKGTVIAIGNASMFTEEWIYENTYQDAFLRMLLRSLSTLQPVSLDIDVKSAVRPILSVGSLLPAVIIACIFPLIVLLAALIILLPRRHK